MKGEQDALEFLNGFKISEGIKNKIVEKPFTTPLTMDNLILFSNVKPITIDMNEMVTDLTEEILKSDYLASFCPTMEYLLITAFALTSSEYNKHKDEPHWLFFRYIRNAAAHGGRFNFTVSIKEAQWNDIVIDKSLQDSKLFKTNKHDGLLNLGDAILFLLDIEKEYQIKI